MSDTIFSSSESQGVSTNTTIILPTQVVDQSTWPLGIQSVTYKNISQNARAH